MNDRRIRMLLAFVAEHCEQVDDAEERDGEDRTEQNEPNSKDRLRPDELIRRPKPL
jgi:hypothetical protein